MVDWHGAMAYAAWEARRTGLPWRLPGASEWEKAARGVDGRFYPWGDHIDPSWCCIHVSHDGPARPIVVDSFPVDCSPWGVRGLGGNVRDWCRDLIGSTDEAPDDDIVPEPLVGDPATRAQRWICGGAWDTGTRNARSAGRGGSLPTARYPNVGFRLVRSL